jgi:hypothetical protein
MQKHKALIIAISASANGTSISKGGLKKNYCHHIKLLIEFLRGNDKKKLILSHKSSFSNNSDNCTFRFRERQLHLQQGFDKQKINLYHIKARYRITLIIALSVSASDSRISNRGIKKQKMNFYH